MAPGAGVPHIDVIPSRLLRTQVLNSCGTKILQYYTQAHGEMALVYLPQGETR